MGNEGQSEPAAAEHHRQALAAAFAALESISPLEAIDAAFKLLMPHSQLVLEQGYIWPMLGPNVSTGSQNETATPLIV